MTEARTPQETLGEIAAANEHLLATVASLTDEQVAGPSALPGWTRGHVLTHVARNAEALARLMTWASTGVETPAYASPEARDADIAAGAGRGVAEILADLRDTADRFAHVASALTPQAWTAVVRRPSGPISASELPAARLTELYVHHVDLDAGYTPAHWPDSFVERELPVVAARLSTLPGCPSATLRLDEGGELRLGADEAAATVVSGPGRALLAWLMGRASGDGLTTTPSGPLPELPTWL